MSEPSPLVAEMRGLSVATPGGESIVDDVSLALRRGETLGIVGESGSGKTTTALALLGYTQGGARITAGEVLIDGNVVPASAERQMRRLRGSSVTYVPQNPGTALDPSMRIGGIVQEMLSQHRKDTPGDTSVADALTNVGLPGDREFQRRYPHQLSGGQQQRVCISVAVVCEPPVVVLDEPTTGLDVVTQAKIIAELVRLREEHGISIAYVSHDLAVVAQLADRIAVMYGGQVIEQGPAKDILRSPSHPYTRGLLNTVPDHAAPRVLEPMSGVAVGVGERPRGCRFGPRCQLCIEDCRQEVPALRQTPRDRLVRCIRPDDVPPPAAAPVRYATVEPDAGTVVPALCVSSVSANHRVRGGTVSVVRDVSFVVGRGQCVALVGESGSGKTTLARTVAGLHPAAGGSIELDGEALAPHAKQRPLDHRRRLQIIFQNPSDALNPRRTVRATLARPVQLFRKMGWREAVDEADALLDLVRLPRRVADRYPGELSGGERQRIGIARGLAAKPSVLICDEITSALDVSVQAAVLALLSELREELGLSMLFITHDLGVVATVADEVLVLDRGVVCESGPTAAVLGSPRNRYTQELLGAAPSISAALAGTPVTAVADISATALGAEGDPS